MVPLGFPKTTENLVPPFGQLKPTYIYVLAKSFIIKMIFFSAGVIGVYSEWNFIKHRKQRHLAAKNVLKVNCNPKKDQVGIFV